MDGVDNSTDPYLRKYLPGIHGPSEASLLSSKNFKHELSSHPEGSLVPSTIMLHITKGR
jgi:hypothetical protein